MTLRALILAIAVISARVVHAGPADSLARLGQFVARHYCCEQEITERDITFTAPLIGEPVTLLHFFWDLKSFDEYGRKVRTTSQAWSATAPRAISKSSTCTGSSPASASSSRCAGK
jgi:hypothetical protein